jgi:hypothetical protein
MVTSSLFVVDSMFDIAAVLIEIEDVAVSCGLDDIKPFVDGTISEENVTAPSVDVGANGVDALERSGISVEMLTETVDSIDVIVVDSGIRLSMDVTVVAAVLNVASSMSLVLDEVASRVVSFVFEVNISGWLDDDCSPGVDGTATSNELRGRIVDVKRSLVEAEADVGMLEEGVTVDWVDSVEEVISGKNSLLIAASDVEESMVTSIVLLSCWDGWLLVDSSSVVVLIGAEVVGIVVTISWRVVVWVSVAVDEMMAVSVTTSEDVSSTPAEECINLDVEEMIAVLSVMA